jgi:hypothetical protein
MTSEANMFSFVARLGLERLLNQFGLLLIGLSLSAKDIQDLC